MPEFTLVSHILCPYAQRVAISLAEKGLDYTRIDIDLGDKPVWFVTLSPLGKVPLLQVTEDSRTETIFDSAVILEYLEETGARPLHPANPLQRARHRSWIEFGSAMLNTISRLYHAGNAGDFQKETDNLQAMADRLEAEIDRLHGGPYFTGKEFSLIDAVYGPVFRYFDVFETEAGLHLLEGRPRLAAWRAALSQRSSVRRAVPADYDARLTAFLHATGGEVSRHMAAARIAVI
jgi:glutathione S-transferase